MKGKKVKYYQGGEYRIGVVISSWYDDMKRARKLYGDKYKYLKIYRKQLYGVLK